jgi:flavorubredoxin
MPAVQICEGVYWVGVQDPDLRVFDIIMETKFGTSYGAYLVKGQDAAALIDTVKEEFCDEYLDNLRSVIDLSRIKYLLINHPDREITPNKGVNQNCNKKIAYSYTPIKLKEVISIKAHRIPGACQINAVKLCFHRGS